MRKVILALAVACPILLAQDNDPAVSFSDGPGARGWTQIYKYTTIGESEYLSYVCYARVNQPEITNAVSQIVVSSNVGTATTSGNHGLRIGNRIVVSGATGGGTGLNTAYVVATTPTGTTLTFATSGVSNATYNNAGIALVSSSPRSNRAVWAIRKNYYGGTSGTLIIHRGWGVKPGLKQSSPGAELVCDDSDTLAYQ